MAVAGGGVPSVALWMDGDELKVGASMIRAQNVVYGPETCVQMLRHGKPCNLRLFGDNLTYVRAAMSRKMSPERK